MVPEVCAGRYGAGRTRAGRPRGEKRAVARPESGAAVGVAEEKMRGEWPTSLQWLLFLNSLETLREISDLNQ